MTINRYVLDAVRLLARRLSSKRPGLITEAGHVQYLKDGEAKSAELVASYFRAIREHSTRLEKAGISGFIRNRIGLELGSGPGLGISCWCLGQGASAMVASDIEDNVDWALARALLAVYGVAGKEPKFVPRIRAENCSSLPNQSFDFIVSACVLEHVNDIKSVAAENFRILKRGGKAYHIIGAADHRYKDDSPLEFLTLPDYQQAIIKLGARVLGSYGENRLRFSQYSRAFESEGFNKEKVMFYHPIPREYIERIKPKFTSRFQGLPEEDYSYKDYLPVFAKPL